MIQPNRFWKIVLITIAATLAALAVIFMFLWQRLTPQQCHAIVTIINEHFLSVASMVLICAGVILVSLEIIFAIYIKPLKKICAEASVIYASNPSHRLSVSGPADIRQLSGIINDFADMFENLNKDITQQILSARKETEKERNLLAAIMAELPQGVIICNNNGRILLFNSVAKNIFMGSGSKEKTEYFIGLGRSIFHLIDKTLIAHALSEIEDRLKMEKAGVASYFITPIHSGCLISAVAIPVLDQDKNMTGFILTFQDVTHDINQFDNIFKKTNRFRTQLLSHDPEKALQYMAPDQFQKLYDQYEDIVNTILDAVLTKIPLGSLSIVKFINSLKAKLDSGNGIRLDTSLHINHMKILGDTYSLTTALIFLLENLSGMTGEKIFQLSCTQAKDTIVFIIKWHKAMIRAEDINNLLFRPINGLPSLFYVFRQNRACFNIIGNENNNTCQINISLQAESKKSKQEKRQSPVITGSRPEFYDFNLFRTEDEDRDLLDTSLKNITYTVFDTETTGLDPDGGDEIISIAAVRVVNTRIIYQDIFEELVDPKRDIPIESYKIHGINYEMVTGKKDINAILPMFKKFASDTVLVGHNIAFDMKMLKVKEKTSRIKFTNPVLDTLLLSAILHPLHEHHDMENIAKRLGVNIIGRHTALGDAIATAEIFLKLLPILNSNGILTLRDAIKASKKTYYARLKY
jgi:DNA polymerase-3 subunit epsilon